VFFRDTQHILQIVTMAWFFLTPIFYAPAMQVDHLPAAWQWAVFLNPMTGLTCVYRSILMSEPLPALSGICISFSVCWALLAAGAWMFIRLEKRFGDEL
jgi:ABC-type polysaccharide/polyol phosphate export permease